MIRPYVRKRLAFAIAVCLLYAMLVYGQHETQTKRNDDIVAVVENIEIRYGDIKVDLNAPAVRLKYENAKGREPDIVKDRDDLEMIRDEIERNNLAQRIYEIVRSRLIRRFGITVDEREVQYMWRQAMRNGGLHQEDLAEERRASLERILDALKDVVVHGRAAEVVYEEKLKDMMSLKEWLLRVKYEGKKEIIEKMEELLRRANLGQTDLSLFREILLKRKLDVIIDRELARQDPKVGQELSLAGARVGATGGWVGVSDYVKERRRLWWQERYREAAIEIMDPDFEVVLRTIRGEAVPRK